MKASRINISPMERMGRVAFGGALTVGGLALLFHANSATVTTLTVLLVVAGLDLFVTGATGFCPLYRFLGYVPRSLRSRA